jgi:hypothetical protein
MDLPLEYRVSDASHLHGALVVNASESGILVNSLKEVPVGAKLDISVLFPNGYELTNFRVLAEIVWKDILWKENWIGYQLGLKFVHILEGDHQKLKQLLDNGHEI